MGHWPIIFDSTMEGLRLPSKNYACCESWEIDLILVIAQNCNLGSLEDNIYMLNLQEILSVGWASRTGSIAIK